MKVKGLLCSGGEQIYFREAESYMGGKHESVCIWDQLVLVLGGDGNDTIYDLTSCIGD